MYFGESFVSFTKEDQLDEAITPNLSATNHGPVSNGERALALTKSFNEDTQSVGRISLELGFPRVVTIHPFI